MIVAIEVISIRLKTTLRIIVVVVCLIVFWGCGLEVWVGLYHVLESVLTQISWLLMKPADHDSICLSTTR